MSSDSCLILFSAQPSLGFGLYSFSKVVFLIIEEVTRIEDRNIVCQLTTHILLKKPLFSKSLQIVFLCRANLNFILIS